MERQKQKDDRRVKQKTKDKRHEKKAKKAKDKEHKKDKEKKRKRVDGSTFAQEGVSDDDLPQSDPDDSAGEGEEADLWNSIGAAEAPSSPVPVQHSQPIMVGGLSETGETAAVLDPLEDHVIQVPMESRDRVAEKLEVVGNMVKTAQLLMHGSTVHISGPADAKLLASQCVSTLVDNHVAEGVTDVTSVHVLPEWADTWNGCTALEKELGVLVIFETLRGRAAYSLGQLAGLPYEQRNAKGQQFHKYQPVIVKKMSPGGTKVKVTWCWDGLLKDEDASKLQAAVRVSILGTPESRAKAVLRILMSADEGAQGLLASQIDVLEQNSDVFGCNGGPGGVGLQKFELAVDQPALRKLLRLGSMPDALGEGNEFIDRVRMVSQCRALCVYQRTVGVTTSYRSTTQQILVAVGSRGQRWMAAEMLRMMILVLGAIKTENLGALPPKLAADCHLLNVPQQALAAFWGKKNGNYRKLLKDTNTIVIPIRNLHSSEDTKLQEEEVENYMANLYKMAEAEGTEFAFFGTPLAQKLAIAKTLLLVEKQMNGYVMRTSPPNEVVDTVEHPGLDKVRLSYDFQEEANTTKEDILSAASGCHALCLNDLLLLVGGSKERQRAREYARLMVGKALGKHGKFPAFDEADARADVISIWVDEAVTRSRWFRDKLTILMSKSGLCAFFVDSINEQGERRLCFAGHKLEKARHDMENNPAIAETLEQTRELVQGVVGGRSQKPPNGAWWSEWSWQRNKRTWQNAGPDEPESLSKAAKTEKSPQKTWQSQGPGAESGWESTWESTWETKEEKEWTSWSWEAADGSQDWNGWEWKEQDRNVQPTTPAGFGPHGNSAPQTPAPSIQHAAPQTPAGFGPHGNSAPQTPLPAVGHKANSVPEPATPAFHRSHASSTPHSNVPEPATPGPGKHASSTPRSNVPEPATPAFNKPSRTPTKGGHVPEPATPAPKPSRTPRGAASVPEPSTPAFPKTHSLQATPKRVPEPATPAFNRGSQSLQATPKGVPDPATPAFHRGVPDPSTPAFHRGPQATPNGVPDPATPAFHRGSQSLQATPKGVPDPATPAFHRGSQSLQATPKGVPDPATPAFHRGPPAHPNRVPDPVTPAFNKAPQAPQATPNCVPEPATPAFNKNAIPGPATPFAQAHRPENPAANSIPSSDLPNGQSGTSSARPAPITPAAAKAPPMNGAAEDDLPPGWQKCISKKYGKAYYFNAELKKSQYERPTS